MAANWSEVNLKVLAGPEGSERRRSDALIAAARDAVRAAGGASANALLADHWFVAGPGAGGILTDLHEAGLVTDRGAAVGVTLPDRVVAMGELTFARAADGGTRFLAPTLPGTAVFARHSQTHFWITARSLSPTLPLVGETEAVMAAIAATMVAQGWRFDAVCKATTHYVGGSAAEELHDNMAVRNAYYRRPGPASTGLPVASFPFSPSKIAVDLLGTTE
jgi:hypothetical protein